MAQLELPFPELVVEDFKRGWIRFKFVARAKEWNKKTMCSNTRVAEGEAV